MGKEKGAAERAVTVPLYDADYLFAANILKNLYLGPGKSGPGDEWTFPTEPLDRSADGAIVMKNVEPRERRTDRG